MSNLSGLLLADAVLPKAQGGSRKNLISELSGALAKATGLDQRAVFDAVLERERLGSTGVGEGVAIPHARVEGVSKPVGGFARLETPIEFDAIDDRPCDLVFMLLAPISAGADHLRALAKVSRVLRQEDVRKALRDAHSVEAVLAILSGTTATNAA
ncbi:MAG: PTS IIA-like nitrogen regulatory protein PtsN [Pseudomonadota bacterium]